jgi:3-oxoacyl-[acyl-carrier-protein] synthase II
LRDAGVNPDEVQYINAHGTSTPLGDIAETGVKLALGDAARKLVVNSTKSMTGHLLGASGWRFEAVFTALAVHHQISPPTINIFNQDPACDLDYMCAVKNDFGGAPR